MQGKTQALQGDYEHVCSSDPAIDQKAKGWRATYDAAIETSALDTLPLKAGSKPVVWKLRQLGRRERAHVRDTLSRTGVNRASEDAVRLALVGADGAHDSAGDEIVVDRNERVAEFLAVNEAVLDRIEQTYGPEILGELWVRVAASLNPQRG